ncbi:hypothetical protein VTI74DRAFT_2987 [Chaetomium olivicolor]
MRFTSILLAAGLALFANAQTSTGNNAPTTTQDAASAAQTSLQAEMIRCIEACPAGDVSCTSKCIAVPNPNESQVNATNTCVAACPQGNGTEAETAKYSECIQKCIGEHYFTASGGTPQPTGNTGNGNSGSNNNNGGSSSGSNSNPTGTGTVEATGTKTTGGASAATSTGAAAVLNLKGASGVVGVMGFLAAFMAI